MKRRWTFEEIIDYAIDKEMDEVEFYSEVASRMDRKHVKGLFGDIALEKTARMLRLEKMKDAKPELNLDEIKDMKITGSLEDVDHTRNDFTYQDALIIAMKKEKIAFRLYKDLASAALDEPSKKLFLVLAQEEAKHKLCFEVEYNNNILTEN
ncbi:ferritin family protein [Labilibaculum manganireducens]|uniref:ferritin-like domain-containing protein n=1 Tax=Labilibaculum manganireducens TaxID=1940525 RepID=UPI0029F5690B|nr:ferritin family protein [Labilibaculum manganireducens]